MKSEDKIYRIDPKKLVPYENNPRVNDEAVDKVIASIKAAAGDRPLEEGFKDPIEVDEDMVVICGHTRLKAALKMGLTQVRVIVHHFDTPEAENLYRLTNNKAGEFSYWDTDKLAVELEPLGDIYDLEELGLMQEDYNDDDLEDPDGGEEQARDTGDSFVEKNEYSIILSFPTETARNEAFESLVDSGYLCRKL